MCVCACVIKKKKKEKEAKAVSWKLPGRLLLYGPEERVIPFNRGIEFFPDVELLAQGAHDSAGLNPPQLAHHSSPSVPNREREKGVAEGEREGGPSPFHGQ